VDRKVVETVVDQIILPAARGRQASQPTRGTR